MRYCCYEIYKNEKEFYEKILNINFNLEKYKYFFSVR